MDAHPRSAGNEDGAATARELRQAALVLEREGLSERQRRLFTSFVLSVWVTWGLFALWFIVLLSPFYEGQQAVLIAAAGVFVVAVVLFVFNLPVAKRLWSAFATERRLGIGRHVSRLIARVSATKRWFRRVRRMIDIGLFGVGLGLSLIAGWALAGEVRSSLGAAAARDGNWGQLFGVFCLFLFGLACVAMPPMQWARRRLDAVERLRAAIHSGSRTADDLVLIETLQRTQILMRRAGNREKRRSGKAAAMRLSPRFRESLSALDEHERRQVFAALGTALNRAEPGPETAAGDRERQIAVAGTDLTIAVSQSADESDLTALDVLRGGRPVDRRDVDPGAAGATEVTS